MCKLKSMILTKDGVFCPNYDSHSDMLVEMGIQDNRRVPDFVKIEITPPDGDMCTTPDKWAYTVDQDWLPSWYVQGVDEPRCRKSLIEWYGGHVFTDGHHEVHGGKVWLYDNASATLYGNASAELYASASVELYASASAKLYDNASATLYGNASVELYDRSVSIYRADYWSAPVIKTVKGVCKNV